MPVMDVRKVRMPVSQLPVLVHMRMWLRSVPVKVVAVLVVGVVAVHMAVGQGNVLMVMRMVLAEVQPDARSHQTGGNPEQQVCGLAKQHNRQCRADKWRSREIGACQSQGTDTGRRNGSVPPRQHD
ncbi:MAG: hypothetical protein RIR09_2438, partial [Pseudomonadota bacterium]